MRKGYLKKILDRPFPRPRTALPHAWNAVFSMPAACNGLLRPPRKGLIHPFEGLSVKECASSGVESGLSRRHCRHRQIRFSGWSLDCSRCGSSEGLVSAAEGLAIPASWPTPSSVFSSTSPDAPAFSATSFSASSSLVEACACAGWSDNLACGCGAAASFCIFLSSFTRRENSRTHERSSRRSNSSSLLISITQRSRARGENGASCAAISFPHASETRQPFGGGQVPQLLAQRIAVTSLGYRNVRMGHRGFVCRVALKRVVPLLVTHGVRGAAAEAAC